MTYTSRLIAAALPFALVLGGCALNPGHPWTDYTLPAAAPTTSPPPAQRAAAVLRVDPIAAPAWLDTRNMYYRLDYHNAAEVLAYSESRWQAPPPEMLRGILVEHLAGSGDWKAVLGSNDSAQANYALHLRLLAFEQDFSSPQASAGVLRIRASLVDLKNDAVRAQKTFDYHVPASAANAQAGAAALAHAGDVLAQQLQRWLLEVR